MYDVVFILSRLKWIGLDLDKLVYNLLQSNRTNIELQRNSKWMQSIRGLKRFRRWFGARGTTIHCLCQRMWMCRQSLIAGQCASLLVQILTFWHSVLFFLLTFHLLTQFSPTIFFPISLCLSFVASLLVPNSQKNTSFSFHNCACLVT